MGRRRRRDLIFGKQKSAEQRYRQWKEIQAHAGISEPHFDFHALRSTCGTDLFEQSPGAAQEMLGHSSIQTTRRYYVKLSRHLREAAATRKQPLPFYGSQGLSVPAATIKIGEQLPIHGHGRPGERGSVVGEILGRGRRCVPSLASPTFLLFIRLHNAGAVPAPLSPRRAFVVPSRRGSFSCSGLKPGKVTE
jgi:hypothetical protein